MPPRPTPTAAATLRPATRTDLPAILHIELASFTTQAERFHHRQVRDLVNNPRAIVTVAELHGQVAGWAAGLLRTHHSAQGSGPRGRALKSGRLYAVAVHPDAQGQKLGRRLVEHTLAALTARGARRIYLEVRQDNASAIALYHKLGFTQHRHLPHYYARGRHGISMCREG